MKKQNRISQLTLELYYRGLTTRKETKQVEKVLLTDLSVRERYETLKKQEHEIDQLVSKELNRLNIPETPPIQTVHSIKFYCGVIAAAAAVVIGVLVPVFLHLKHNPNKTNAVAESSAEEIKIEDNSEVESLVNTSGGGDGFKSDENENKPEKKAPEQPVKKEKGNNNKKTVITEKPRNEPAKDSKKQELKPDSAELQPGKTEIAAMPTPDTGVRLRGGKDEEQSNTAATPEQEDNSGIPPGMTFIFENMFADKLMVGILIPDRIKRIGKNAYAGNPVLVVTIGANVDVHEDAIPGNFAKAYNKYGKAAGIYRRKNSETEEWEKM